MSAPRPFTLVRNAWARRRWLRARAGLSTPSTGWKVDSSQLATIAPRVAKPHIAGRPTDDGRWAIALYGPDGEIVHRFVGDTEERALIGLGLRLERARLVRDEEKARLRVDSSAISTALRQARP